MARSASTDRICACMAARRRRRPVQNGGLAFGVSARPVCHLFPPLGLRTSPSQSPAVANNAWFPGRSCIAVLYFAHETVSFLPNDRPSTISSTRGPPEGEAAAGARREIWAWRLREGGAREHDGVELGIRPPLFLNRDRVRLDHREAYERPSSAGSPRLLEGHSTASTWRCTARWRCGG